MKNPKVSIILPAYNSSAFLPRAIASVLHQDFVDFELLVVDDGSTDDTAEIIREMQNDDERICYLSIPHRGVGFARDAGLRQVRGEYIAWIDSDDLWLPGKLKDQVNILESYPEIDILFADWWNINDAYGMKELGFSQNKQVMDSLQLERIEDGLFRISASLPEALLKNSLIHFQTVLWRADILTRTGGIDPSLGSAEDFEFFWRAALFGGVFAYLDRPLAERYKYATGITSDRIFSWTETLQALEHCAHWSQKTGRQDLIAPICTAEQRAYRNLVWEHGLRGERSQVLHVAFASLQTGVSLRTFVFTCAALLGRRIQDWIERLHSR